MRVEPPFLDIIAPPHAPEERPSSLPSPPLPRSNYPFLWRPFQTELKSRAPEPRQGTKRLGTDTRPPAPPQAEETCPVPERLGNVGGASPCGSGPTGAGALTPTGAHTLSPSLRIPGASATQEEQASCA